MDSSPTQLYASLQEAGIDNLLESLSQKSQTQLRFKQNEQRDEPDLTNPQKLEILRNKLNNSPGSFLFQFGHYLKPVQLELFSSIRQTNFEVDYYLKDIEKLNPDVEKKRRKNRRYEALQRLVDKSDYFTEEEMQKRNPILFDQLIGRYHTKEEREAFLQQCSRQSNSVSSSLSRGGGRPTPLSDMLIAHMNRENINEMDVEDQDNHILSSPFKNHTCSQRRMEQETQLKDELDADKDSGEDDEVHEETMDDDGGLVDDPDNVEEIDEEEKELFKEEFFTTMYRNFLEGKDEDFDYTTVDNNSDYDCGETLEQDEEEKYFDSDDPIVVTDDNSKNSNNEALSNHEANSDEEDALDVYMKSLTNELSVEHNETFQTLNTTDFDYTAVDNNSDYDCGETLEQDEEEKYFDADDPIVVSDDKSKNSNNEALTNHETNSDEEDALDVYMKSLTNELSMQHNGT